MSSLPKIIYVTDESLRSDLKCRYGMGELLSERRTDDTLIVVDRDTRTHVKEAGKDKGVMYTDPPGLLLVIKELRQLTSDIVEGIDSKTAHGHFVTRLNNVLRRTN